MDLHKNPPTVVPSKSKEALLTSWHASSSPDLLHHPKPQQHLQKEQEVSCARSSVSLGSTGAIFHTALYSGTFTWSKGCETCFPFPSELTPGTCNPEKSRSKQSRATPRASTGFILKSIISRVDQVSSMCILRPKELPGSGLCVRSRMGLDRNGVSVCSKYPQGCKWPVLENNDDGYKQKARFWLL